MIGLVTSSIILAGIAAAFIAIQGSYHSEAQIKSAVEGSRIAVSYLERQVRMAGYGLDPRFAFDFGAPGSAREGQPAGHGPIWTDDLAFRYRDPTFLRRGTASGGQPRARLLGRVRQVRVQGQGAAGVRRGLQRRACAGESSASRSDTDLTNASQVAVAADAALGQGSTAEPCFSDGGDPAYVMLLREARIRVMTLGNPARPYLVRFNTLADPTTSTDYDPIAADVEDFQVSYLLNRPALRERLLRGDHRPRRRQPELDRGRSTGPTSSRPTVARRFDVDYDNSARFTNIAANIRGVRLTLVTRSVAPEPAGAAQHAPVGRERRPRADPPTATSAPP